MSLVTPEDIGERMGDPSNLRHQHQRTALGDEATVSLAGNLGRKLDDPAGKDQPRTQLFGLELPSNTLILPDVITAPTTFLSNDPLFEVRESVTTNFRALDSLADLEFVNVDDKRRGVYTYVVRRTGRFFSGSSGFSDSSEWPCGPDLIRATYKTGYDVVNVPAEIKALVLEQASITFRGRTQISGTVNEQLAGTRRQQVQAASDGRTLFPAHIQPMFERWRDRGNPRVPRMANAG